MTIDTGFNIKFNSAVPIPGVRQPSKPIRDNFAIIKRAIENLQSVETHDDSRFAVSSQIESDGSFKFSVGYRDNALILPIGAPTSAPVEGMLRYGSGGVLQVYNGASWSIVSGPSILDIIAALSADPDLIALIQNGNLPDFNPVFADGTAGLMTGADKTKLDRLGPAFTRVVAANDSGLHPIDAEYGSSILTIRALGPLTLAVSGKEIQLGINLPPQTNAIANSTSGYMTGADKAKLDSLVTTDATSVARGYMTALDKAKLANLAQSFSRIDVNNGPILASTSGSFEITGSSGISVNAIPGQQKIAIALNNIGGQTPTRVANVVAAFSASRYRIATPLPDTSAEEISHTLNLNATADILFTWVYAGPEGEVDFFRITVNESTASTTHTFGSAAVTERTYEIPANVRSFVLNSATPDHYYTIYVQALRYVDIDINPTGVILGNPRKVLTSGKNPYRPEANVVFSGKLSGTSTNRTIDQLFADIVAAQAGAVWNNVIGDGRPTNNADVTALNTSLNTSNVGSLTATQVNTFITSHTASIASLQQAVNDFNVGGSTGSTALQNYVSLAQAAKNAAESAAAAVNTQFTSISAMRVEVEQNKTTAISARDAATAASAQALTSANALQSAATAASASATAAAGSRTLAETSATSAQQSATAAQSANLAATLSVAQTRPYDFERDGLFWDGFTTSGQGATYQPLAGYGRTYRQQGSTMAWITPKRPFLSRAQRRIRAVVKARYFADGIDAVGQHVSLIVKGVRDNGTYADTNKGTIIAAPGLDRTRNDLYASDGWVQLGLDFIADSAFIAEFPYFNVWFAWNETGGHGQIEILTFNVDDINESGKAEDAAIASVAASSAATVSRDAASTSAQSAAQSGVEASTQAGLANTYRLDAAEAANTATTAKNTAVQQAGVATNAAIDSQYYSNAAVTSQSIATSEANRASSVADATIAASILAQTKATEAQNAATAVVGYATTASTKSTESAQAATAAQLAALSATTSANSALSNAQATAVHLAQVESTSTEVQIAATAIEQFELSSRSARDDAATSATAAASSAAAAGTSATTTTQMASASASDSLAAALLVSALLPPDFRDRGKFWSVGATGTPETRITLPVPGTYVNNTTFGTVFQSLPQAGTIGPVGAQRITVGRTYRTTVIARALTLGTSSLFAVEIIGLSSDYLTVTNTFAVGSANPLNYTAGWQTFTKDFKNTDIGGATFFRPLVRYNQTAGSQLIEIREIRIEDVTESKNAATAASAALATQGTVLTYRNETVSYASAVQMTAATAQTAAGTAQSSAIQAASSMATAEGYKNQAQQSYLNAVESEGLANAHVAAASGYASSAQTSSSGASQSAASAAASALTASTASGSIVPSGFANDGQYWVYENNGTPTYQQETGYGRTVKIPSLGGLTTISPYDLLLPDSARYYRATVKARYFLDGSTPADQLCKFTFEGFNPSNAISCVQTANNIGVLSATISASDGWVSFSVDYHLTTSSTQIRPRFVFNAGPGGAANGTLEVLSFRIEDISESSRAKGFADAAQTSASQANAYQTASGNSASSATESANIASAAATRVLNMGSQGLSSGLPYDFSLGSTYFTNQLYGQNPGDVTVGAFVTVT